MKGAARFLPVFVAAAAALAFLPCIPNAFQWDDKILFFRPELRAWTWGHLLWMWTTTTLGHYTPLSWMSWGADRALWDFLPFGFHLTNVLLHAANAALACLLADRLFAKLFPSENETVRRVSAAAAALFFALHPLRVESVAWATERRGLLSGFFCLLAALRHLDGDRRWPPALVLLGVLAKETAMAWPPALFVMDVVLLRTDTPLGWLRKNPLLAAASLAGAAAGAWATGREGIPVTWEQHGPHARLAQFFHGMVFFGGKVLWPAGLSPLYSLSLNAGGVSPGRWAAAGAGVLLTVFAVLARRRFPAFSASWAAHVILLAPTAGLLQSGPQDAADRYTYLAALPWAFWFGRLARGKGAALLLALPVLAVLTVRQERFWRTPETLWRRAVDVSPGSAYAQYNLGTALTEEGRWVEADESFRRALVLEPTMVDAMYNLAVFRQRTGRRRGAEDYYRRILWIDPRHLMALNNLGRLLLDQGRPEEARPFLAEALRLMPDSPVVRKNWDALNPLPPRVGEGGPKDRVRGALGSPAVGSSSPLTPTLSHPKVGEGEKR